MERRSGRAEGNAGSPSRKTTHSASRLTERTGLILRGSGKKVIGSTEITNEGRTTGYGSSKQQQNKKPKEGEGPRRAAGGGRWSGYDFFERSGQERPEGSSGNVGSAFLTGAASGTDRCPKKN